MKLSVTLNPFDVASPSTEITEALLGPATSASAPISVMIGYAPHFIASIIATPKVSSQTQG